MKGISVTDFKAHCMALLNGVAITGQPVILTKRGKPTVMVSRPPSNEGSPKWVPGQFASTARIAGDIISPLDEHCEAMD